MDIEKLKDHFETDGHKVAVFTALGRQYPVTIHHLAEPCADYVSTAVDTVWRLHTSEPPGDVLVFLTGQEEIETVLGRLHEREGSGAMRADRPRFMLIPLHCNLSLDEQQQVFRPTPKGLRKVVVATSVAEASITISGIVYVVDSGFVKVRVFNPRTHVDTLLVTAISKASAVQRAGRAGRLCPGRCYRLYTQAGYDAMDDASTPEIQRSDMTDVVLQLKALGVERVAQFEFVNGPPSAMVIRALEVSSRFCLRGRDTTDQL